MTVDTPAPAALPILRDLVVKGSAFVANPAQPAGFAPGLWTGRARYAVGLVFGKDSREVDHWCPPPAADPSGATVADRVARRLPAIERLVAMLSQGPAGHKVFIGHGRSSEWLKLRIFLSQSLALPCDEFNIESVAGFQTGDRLEGMLNAATLAFLVLTGEDEHTDGSLHARQNVIHEVGLFQAKLGMRRAIVMLEAGCNRPSNLDGLTTINFPKGDVMARSELVRGVLVREQLLD